MHLNQNDLEALCLIAIIAARKAGVLIAEYSNKNVSVQKKQGGDSLASQVVTEVDLKSQAIVLEIIRPTFDAYDLGLLTEESTDDLSRLKKDYFWCIDPMDGTLPFTLQKPGYAVSIALVAQDGTPQIGVVFDPVKQTLYHAIIGCGAFRNEKPWKWNGLNSNNRALTFVHDISFKDDVNFHEVLNEIENISSEFNCQGVNVITWGGAVMNALWVLENIPACYFKLPKKQTGGGSFWDFAATACIYVEAGAWVSDLWGRPLDFTQTASTFMNQRGVLFASHSQLALKIIEINT